jgi:hypothetical protein
VNACCEGRKASAKAVALTNNSGIMAQTPQADRRLRHNTDFVRDSIPSERSNTDRVSRCRLHPGGYGQLAH